MKNLTKIVMFCVGGFFVGCSTNDPSATSSTSSVSLNMVAASSSSTSFLTGRTSSSGARAAVDSTNGATVSDVIVNVRDISFKFSDRDKHFCQASFQKDSSYSESNNIKLKGPFLVDLVHDSSFVQQVITSVDIPKASYEQVRFKLSPDTVAGDMKGKSIMITGKINNTPFVFWFNRDINFSTRFRSLSDTTALSSNNAQLTINFELNKIFNVFENGIDISKAVDGNKDGIITIDPNNDDGNGWIAYRIARALVMHGYCEREFHF